MRRRCRKGISCGTFLALVLSVSVLLGTFIVLRIIGSEDTLSTHAERLIHALMGILPSGGSTAAPDTAIRITTVTQAPAAQGIATAQPSAALASFAPASEIRHTVTLLFGGILSFDQDVVASCFDASTGMYDFSELLSGISGALCSDMNIAAFENILPANWQSGVDYTAPADVLQAVRPIGFDGLLLSCDHALDLGTEGVQATLSCLRANSLLGFGLSDTSLRPHIGTFTLNGADIAVLSYTFTLSSRGMETDEASRASAITLYSKQGAAEDIASARAQGADIIVVSLHWGEESASSPTQAQRAAADELARAGADIIIGANSTAVQEISLISAAAGEGTQRQTLVAYSMGMLLTGSRETGSDVSGALLHVQVTVSESNGQVHFDSIEYTPTYIWGQTVAGKYRYRVICSGADAPEGMNELQEKYKNNALKRIKRILDGGAAVQR